VNIFFFTFAGGCATGTNAKIWKNGKENVKLDQGPSWWTLSGNYAQSVFVVEKSEE
jgi:hypothetical protein